MNEPRRITIRLPREVRGDWPFDETVAPAGEYVATLNPHGAAWVTATDGKELGIKPNEYEIVEGTMEGTA